MTAHYKSQLSEFISTPPDTIIGFLSKRLLQEFGGDQKMQLRAWQEQTEILQTVCQKITSDNNLANEWGILLEYPLRRLERRLDIVLLAGEVVCVIEFKTRARNYSLIDIQQAENYALDLRDFHEASHHLSIVPVLCATHAPVIGVELECGKGVTTVQKTNATSLERVFTQLLNFQLKEDSIQINLEDWNNSPYHPVPTIIEAAELLYAGHNVHEIAHAATDSGNLAKTTDQIIKIIEHSQLHNKRSICFITGIPGSGKTLIGLNTIHDPRFRVEGRSSGAYLSGNTPLVNVLREALAKDETRRTNKSIGQTRQTVRTEIQLLMNYLKEYITEHPNRPPHENVIVFDEAQRAWDEDYGREKFNREASEAALFLEIMGRKEKWSVIIALVGGGQEINKGEKGLSEWGKALINFGDTCLNKPWEVYGAPQIFYGSQETAGQKLFPSDIYKGQIHKDQLLHLSVSVRSYKCEAVARWVNFVIDGDPSQADQIANTVENFSVYVTRSLNKARKWLRQQERGNRRVGLVASSGARRLRADGLGVSLSAQELDAVKHWYLQPSGDIRSSCALEITANEYTCQGLELDYVGVCWGGDMLWTEEAGAWQFRKLSGNLWQNVNKPELQNYVRNTYSVLLTRARLGMIIWIPEGVEEDSTRNPEGLDQTTKLLLECGAILD